MKAYLVEPVAREEVAEEVEAQEQEARRGGREEEEGVIEHIGRGPGWKRLSRPFRVLEASMSVARVSSPLLACCGHRRDEKV